MWLPSGGSLVIDRTEAMTVVDVNTGKFVGSGGNLEQTVTRNNMEAAEEIVRQLRLRDIGGIIVIDFIDMVLESNRDLVLRRLTECLGRDRTKHQVAEVTSLGLVQMTRKRVGQGLLEVFSEPCEHCRGRGVIVHTEPVDEKRRGGRQRLRRLRQRVGGGRAAGRRRLGPPGPLGRQGHGQRTRQGHAKDTAKDAAARHAGTAADVAAPAGDGTATDDEGGGRSGRRSRGRRGRGQAGEERAAEDAAVLTARAGDATERRRRPAQDASRRPRWTPRWSRGAEPTRRDRAGGPARGGTGTDSGVALGRRRRPVPPTRPPAADEVAGGARRVRRGPPRRPARLPPGRPSGLRADGGSTVDALSGTLVGLPAPGRAPSVCRPAGVRSPSRTRRPSPVCAQDRQSDSKSNEVRWCTQSSRPVAASTRWPWATGSRSTVSPVRRATPSRCPRCSWSTATPSPATRRRSRG